MNLIYGIGGIIIGIVLTIVAIIIYLLYIDRDEIEIKGKHRLPTVWEWIKHLYWDCYDRKRNKN